MIEYKKLKNECGIYCFTNKVNGKCYVGQAINLRKRLRSHYSTFRRQDVPNMILYAAVAKYGVENFDLEILELVDSNVDQQKLKDLLDEKEKYYIKVKNSLVPNGYNQTIGGDAGILGYHMTSEQKEKIKANSKEHIQKLMKPIYGWNFINDHEYMAGNSSVMQDIVGVSKSVISKICNNTYKNQWCKSFTFAFTKKELYEKRDAVKKLIQKEHPQNNSKIKVRATGSPIIEYNPETMQAIKEFVSIKEAADTYSISSTSIFFHLNGKSKLCHGKIFKYKESNYKKKNRNASGIKKAIEKSSLTKCVRVDQYDTCDNFIKTFNSIKEAAASVGTNAKSISRVCMGKHRTCKGYKWRYHNVN